MAESGLSNVARRRRCASRFVGGSLTLGWRRAGSTTVTSALHGCRRHDPAARAEFFALAGVAA